MYTLIINGSHLPETLRVFSMIVATETAEYKQTLPLSAQVHRIVVASILPTEPHLVTTDSPKPRGRQSVRTIGHHCTADLP